jgi:hypothetical protein
MSERYLVTGVQLGMLIAISDQEDRQKTVDRITKKQFIGESSGDVVDDALVLYGKLKKSNNK